jgi:hypothetical protein
MASDVSSTINREARIEMIAHDQIDEKPTCRRMTLPLRFEIIRLLMVVIPCLEMIDWTVILKWSRNRIPLTKNLNNSLWS